MIIIKTKYDGNYDINVVRMWVSSVMGPVGKQRQRQTVLYLQMMGRL